MPCGSRTPTASPSLEDRRKARDSRPRRPPDGKFGSPAAIARAKIVADDRLGGLGDGVAHHEHDRKAIASHAERRHPILAQVVDKASETNRIYPSFRNPDCLFAYALFFFMIWKNAANRREVSVKPCSFPIQIGHFLRRRRVPIPRKEYFRDRKNSYWTKETAPIGREGESEACVAGERGKERLDDRARIPAFCRIARRGTGGETFPPRSRHIGRGKDSRRSSPPIWIPDSGRS